MNLIDSCCKQKLGRPQQTLVTQSAKSHIHLNYGQTVRPKQAKPNKQHLKLHLNKNL